MATMTVRRHPLGAPLLALLFILSGCVREPVQSRHPYSPLILISIDGYRADYIERGLSPNLATLARNGVRATAMKPAFPTLTFPNHYTLVTGLYPDHHGIIDNRFLDPVTGAKFVYNDPRTTDDPHWWGGEPLWVSVERQGKQAATMFWPGSDVAIDGVRPEHWRPFDGTVTPDQRVDQLLHWLDLPRGQRPDFATLYFEQVDHAGHGYGPDSPQVNAALREIDAALGRLIAGLKRRGLFASANIVVVSDHGMTATSPDRLVVLDSILDMRDADVITAGVLADLAAKPGHEREVDAALLRPHAHMRCWNKSQVPARLHYGSNVRIPPILCLADDGWLIETRKYLDRPNHHISNGEHGYDNNDPAMRALFVAEGPAFRRGIVVPEFDNVDVYPLLARILGIRPEPNDGDFDAVRDLLAHPDR
ncbi:MAG: ectonucleotide pyrophosphatase/phosphodiesterase [Xanthomonadaceae bacterium]|nr:ectonucleotide pyrophosphatase/phosphodiesterase [Xanthomonadaceae bacterium]